MWQNGSPGEARQLLAKLLRKYTHTNTLTTSTHTHTYTERVAHMMRVFCAAKSQKKMR